MEFQNLIESRRSIRVYDESKKVSREELEELIKAATLAPSWKNSQVSRYYVAASQEAQEKVRKNLASFNDNNTKGAAALIVAAIVKERSGYERDGSASTELCHNEWGVFDNGLACQNLVLKAADMGLGSLIMGIRDAEGMKKDLELPDTEMITAVIAVGYPKTEAVMPKRKAVEDVAKFL